MHNVAHALQNAPSDQRATCACILRAAAHGDPKSTRVPCSTVAKTTRRQKCNYWAPGAFKSQSGQSGQTAHGQSAVNDLDQARLDRHAQVVPFAFGDALARLAAESFAAFSWPKLTVHLLEGG